MAAPAPRSASSPGVRFVPAAQWDDLAGAWTALAHDAAPNAFASPGFALAARSIAGSDGLGAYVIEGDAGLLAFVPGRRRLAGAVFSLWTHAYAPYGRPLIRRGAESLAYDALFDQLARDDVAALDWPLGDDLPHVRDRRVEILDAHARAALDLAAPPPKPDGEQRRLARRLAERGALAFRSTAADWPIEDAAAAFLALEHAGWKGRADTSLAAAPETRAFFDAMIRASAPTGAARIDALTLDGRAIAAGVTLMSGDRAWYWKTAYDETLRRLSPGVQVTAAIADALASEGRIRLVDSCAVPGHSMIEPLWPGRIAMTSRFIAVQSRDGGLAFRVALGLERAARAARREAKAAFARFKRG